MMIAAEDNNKGFNFEFGNDGGDDGFSHANFGGDDDDIAIDADFFFDILNEDLPQLPTDPFYQSTDNTQESGSAVHVSNNEGFLSPSELIKGRRLQEPILANSLANYGAASENSTETVEALEKIPCASPPEIVLAEANEASLGNSRMESGLRHSLNITETESDPFAQQEWSSIYEQCARSGNESLLDGVNYDLMSSNGAMESCIERGLDGSQSCYPGFDNMRGLGGHVGAADMTASEIPVYDFFDVKGSEYILHNNVSFEHVDTVNTFDSSSSTITDEASTCWGVTDNSYVKQVAGMKDEKDSGLFFIDGIEGKNSEFDSFHVGSGTGNFLPSAQAQYSGGVPRSSAVYSDSSAIDRKPTNLPVLQYPLPSVNPYPTFGSSCYKSTGREALVQPVNLKPALLKGTHDGCQASLSEDISDDEVADDDVCIIEDMSAPSRIHQFSAYRNSARPQLPEFRPQCSQLALGSPLHQIGGVSGVKLKANDERLIFQAVVQDLAQPKSESTPPDGLLAVPLLRHQRIALSWMVQKETTSMQCSGGILADDQGLGKTVSTIALILTERASSARALLGTQQGEPETLDLDEEDDKQGRTKIPVRNTESSSSVRGRPSAGTLIVCPTSVLRQWAEELHNKVTSKANLSVYVYHGSNRTKDPYKLAEYDVVLTTYSVVSMEVPKQPVVVKGGNAKLKLETDEASASSKRKRKHSSDKRRSKRETDNGMLESLVLPLARVGWFRVVLDEAQSIKNHRTRVAQACWGLRAKRRWCLSGTPIQNAVDDLYSYFRFLRYDPYSVYNSFNAMVKFPISKNPSSGYRKLQAVLKTIMLRRTKGTLLDGEPIITLPPKTVKLKKVEFSEEERDFYTRLEADSRAQFQAYADSGTVKQNYVNILLMLLRLRQACDHPFLVQGYDSSSVLKSSIHAAKKLPREQQTCLLNSLEASLAICGICNDPPEDAVVSICGHVFCNQCICERLTGDDNQCPLTNCKQQLSGLSVFSKGTLKSCLSDQFHLEGSQICSVSESSDQGELVEPGLPGRFVSSKLKAALEVLQSLSKPQTTISSNVAMVITNNDSLLDKPYSTSCAPDNGSSITSNGSVNANPGVMVITNNDSLLDKPYSTSCAPDNGSSITSNVSVNANPGVTEKAIVFSQWTRMLDLLEDCLKESSIQYRRLDGTMSVVARDKAVKDFKTLPEVSVMIMSLKAASLGLNMVAACHVVLLDLWWNPTTEDQAIDRAHRIGQTRPVTVVRLTVKDTVEDRILALQQKKRELVSSAFGEDETGSRQTRLTVDDLKYLFMA